MGARSERTESASDIDSGPVDTLRVRGPSLLILAFGTGLLATTVWNFLREQRTLTADLPPLAAALIGLSLSTGLLYAGTRLSRSEFDSGERWRVARITLAGGAVFTGIIMLTIMIRAAEGRAVAEAPFVLSTAAGGGGIAGAITGALYARQRRDARIAEYARAQAEQAREDAERAREDAEANRQQLEVAQEEAERLLEEARETNEDLKLINRVLRHDINNSVMIIESRAGFLRDDLDGAALADIDDRAPEFLETIEAQAGEIGREVERTGAVIDTITDEEPDLRGMDLGAALRAQAETVRQSFDATVTVEGLPDGDGPRVVANEILSDVLGNVLTNAVAHHDGDAPTIRVTVTPGEDRVTVRVADDGPGVPDERKERVFHRGESSGEGGFGLFFVDRMMEQYGGTVHVEDADLGGAAFVFELRRA